MTKFTLKGLALCAGAAAIFVWGIAVGTNDNRLLAQLDARAEMESRAACGFERRLVRIEEGLRCLDRSGRIHATLLAEAEQSSYGQIAAHPIHR